LITKNLIRVRVKKYFKITVIIIGQDSELIELLRLALSSNPYCVRVLCEIQANALKYSGLNFIMTCVNGCSKDLFISRFSATLALLTRSCFSVANYRDLLT